MKLEAQKSIFQLTLPASAPDTYVEPQSREPGFDHGFRKLLDERRLAESRREERRQYPRYAVRGEAEIYSQDARHPERGRLSDISRGGCFVEMMPPIAVDTKVSVVLLIAQRRIRAEGVVRSLLPNFGVGVKFVQFAPDDLAQLQEVLAALERGDSLTPIAPSAQPPAAPQASISTPDAQQALEALRRWFGANEVLTRQEFFDLLNRSGRRPAASVPATAPSPRSDRQTG
jgi:molybdopterin biosynthesis enzyme